MKNMYFILVGLFSFLYVISVFSQTNINSIRGSIDTAWVRTYMSALLSQDDDANDMVIDSEGNVYVSGYVSNLEAGIDFCVIKYDKYGNKIWTRMYNSLYNGDDYAASLAIDKYNNIYITGGIYDIYGRPQVCTIKYSPEGELIWVNNQGFQSKHFSSGSDIAVDAAGNVYVTGWGYDSLGYSDLGIVKYNSLGDTLWTRLYNGSANSDDYGRKLCIDGAGNVYITGIACNGAWSDIVTIKFTPDGVKEWDQNYNGASNYQDYPADIGIDSAGNIYVSGTTMMMGGSSSNFVTLKYNNSGFQQWAVEYDGPVMKLDYPIAIAVSPSGSVYVTGYSAGSEYNSDIFTIKYNTDGIPEWSARVDSGSNFNGGGRAIVLDQAGNLYVTGSKTAPDSAENYLTIKYDTNGVEQWRAICDGFLSADEPYAIGVFDPDNVFVTGISYRDDFDILTIKYDRNGIEQWSDRHNGPGLTDDEVVGIASDDSGNIYVSAKSKTKSIDYDYLTLKYNASGELMWTARYDDTSHYADEPAGIVLDKWNNVIVTGNGGLDITTIKYNSNGELQWTVSYDGSSNSLDRALALTVDDSGNIFVTGQCYNTGTLDDIVTLKYNKDGEQQWVSHYNGVENFGDCGWDIIVDYKGNVYVAGETYSAGASSDFITIKYDNNGDTIWTRRYNSGPNGDDHPSAIDIDKYGNIFVTGISYPYGAGSDFLTVKYDSLGDEKWSARYNGTANLNDIPVGVSADKSGNVYVTGHTTTDDGEDILTIKYNSNGDTIWTRQYDGPGGNQNYVSMILVDSLGYAYIAGCSHKQMSGEDFLSVKYNPDGNIEWIGEYTTPGEKSDAIKAMTLDKDGNFIVAGTNASNNNCYLTVIKYIQSTTHVYDGIQEIPLEYNLSQNFPNPFNPVTSIHFEIPKESYVKLKIYNILGQIVSTLIDEKMAAGKYDIKYDASVLTSGIYFYRMEANGFTQTKKLVLMK